MKRNVISLITVLGLFYIEAEPIKSNLGARHLFNEKESVITENPYITDGLFCMWDGEWNVGLGKHNSSTRVWTDIVNGLRLDIQFGSFTKDGLFGTASQALNVISLDDFSDLKSVLTATGCTVEVVCTPLSFDAHGYSFYDIFMVYSVGNSHTHIFDWFRCHSNVFSLTSFGTIEEPISFTAITYQSSPYPRDEMYINGFFKSRGFYTPQNPSSTFAIVIKGGIHCIRIYDRTLSAEEIAYNYEIDKVRLNIP